MKKFSLIYADPPWEYGNKASRGAANNHYPTMKLTDLKRLPVWDLADDNAILAMWYTGTHSDEAKELATAWGFKVRQLFLFTWVKLLQKAESRVDKLIEKHGINDFWQFLDVMNDITRINGGNYSRQNQESCLIAVRGKGLTRKAADVRQIVYSFISEHSGKPAEARFRLERLYGEVPRIELFARYQPPGWATWGNECDQSVVLKPGCFVSPACESCRDGMRGGCSTCAGKWE